MSVILSIRLAALVVWIFLACFGCRSQTDFFLVTNSPTRLYTVGLSGRKKRPDWLFTAEVRYHVYKSGKPFWSNQYLHSGKSNDLSFEIGYPDYRWIGDNILQFYNNENFSEGKPQEAVLRNESDKVIKYLKLWCWDHVLLFDINSGAELSFQCSPPKGSYPGVEVRGEFYDGTTISGREEFDIENGSSALAFVVRVTDRGVIVSSPFVRKPK